MGHSSHHDAAGLALPSVSAIPGIFGKDMGGFEDWICRGLHDKAASCCTKAKRKYYAEAADLGTDIHELREAFLKGEPFSDGVPEYQAKVFDPIARFYKESGYNPLFIEEKMTGVTFGGTLDGAGTFSVPFWENQRATFWDVRTRDALLYGHVVLPATTESVWIEDLKIKSKLDPLHPLQLYGYALLLKETRGVEAEWGLIVRREKNLDKRPEIQLKGYYLPAYKETWDAAVKCWHFLND